jgi:hypothetical protein
MFEQMISALENGTFPDSDLLSKRFSAAMVKKMGVIRTPYSFWPTDTKINPSAKHLLWAAILLQDKENYRMIEAIISSELEEKLRAKGKLNSLKTLTLRVQQLLTTYIDEFIELAPNETFKNTLRNTATEYLPPL